MSRNNKNARNHQRAREITTLHKAGGKGPAQTTPKHGKGRAWWQLNHSYSAFVAGKSKRRSGEAGDEA